MNHKSCHSSVISYTVIFWRHFSLEMPLILKQKWNRQTLTKNANLDFNLYFVTGMERLFLIGDSNISVKLSIWKICRGHGERCPPHLGFNWQISKRKFQNSKNSFFLTQSDSYEIITKMKQVPVNLTEMSGGCEKERLFLF